MAQESAINETGMRYGRLTVLRRQFIPEKHHTYWLCLCDCGKEVAVRGADLRVGRTKSCGCYSKDKCTIFGKKYALSEVLRKYTKAAVLRNHEFKLTDQEIKKLLFDRCSYCGKKPSRNYRQDVKHSVFVNGIDRIDNSKGYIPGNVTTACAICNKMKHQLGVKEFIGHINQIAKYNSYWSKLGRLLRAKVWFLR